VYQLKRKHIFYCKFEEDENSAQDRIQKTMVLKFEHYDLAIREVSHDGFLGGHSSITEPKDRTVGFKRKVQKIKKNCLLSEGVISGNFELEIIKEL
jgi:hypothetical protein